MDATYAAPPPEIVEAPDIEDHEIVHPQIGREVVYFEMAAAVASFLVTILLFHLIT
jgi:hypothetical protein